MFGFDHGHSPYQQPGQAGTAPVQAATTHANTRDGISGFFSRMFSMTTPASRSSSSGYLQPAPATSPDSGEVVLCQPVEGVACQSMAGAFECHPVEGIGCQPVTMVPVPMTGPLSGT
jgi:hypothetical protein